ncbi:MAG: hypothetical protein D8H97_08185 [Neisseria sp.]|jgi:trbC/VIRB2 family|nr:MAG: hypothetical protein D8H97_08185 [Neisseria sp.]
MNQKEKAAELSARCLDAAVRTMQGGKATRVLAAVMLLGCAQLALAAGGFDDANKLAENVRDGIYAFVGIICTIMLLWQGFQVISHKKDWTDILGTCLGIVFTGAAVAFATYLFTKGGKMKFG